MNLNQKNHAGPAQWASRLGLSFVLGASLLLPFQSRAQTTVLSFNNTAPITINDEYSDSSPYPSTIQVPTLAGALKTLTVTLTGLTDPSTTGIELLLVGPSGVGVDLMDFAGNGAVNGINLVIADSGTPFPNTTLTSATYQPSGTGYPSGSSFPSYSPFSGEDTTNVLAGYIGTPLAGTWSLYGFDTEFAGNGALNGGWTLTFTLVTTAPSATTLAATGVTATNATLNAIVNPNGSATTAYFEYGPTTAYGQTAPITSLTAAAGPQTVTNELTLPPNSTYHFQVVAQNSVGTVFGGDQSVSTPAAAPVIATVPDQTINPESLLVITNMVSDANVPPRPIGFSLGAGAPDGANINGSGVFSWTPACEQGSTTNAITIWAVDDGSPALSNSITFNVVVNPCVQVTVGSSAVQIGQTTNLPVSLLTTVALTNVSFTVSTLPGRFGNWSDAPAAGVAATSSDPNPALPQFTFTAPAGEPLLGAGALGVNIPLGTITVEALPTGNSTFATLQLTAISANDTNDAAVTPTFGISGRMVLIAAQPLLDISLTNQNMPLLTLYGNPGSNYIIMASTNIIPPVTWHPISTNTLTSAVQSTNLGPTTNMMQFFRTEQQ